MLRTWTFGQRMAAGFAMMALAVTAMGAVAFYALGTVVDVKDRVIQHIDQNLIDAERLGAATQRRVAGFRGYLLTADEGHLEHVRTGNREFEEALASIQQRRTSALGARLIAAFAVADAEYQQVMDGLIARRRAQEDITTIAAEFDARVVPKFEALAQGIRRFIAETRAERDAQRLDASRDAERATTAMAVIGGAALILAFAIAFFLTRGLTRQIGSSVQHMRSASAELQAAATQQASGIREQATAMGQIATTIGELLATSRQIAESGQHVAKMAVESADGARGGEQAVRKAQGAVSSIREQVDAIVHHMLDLGRRSQQIGGVLEIINELAEQTNILAINATIEAAGAGEAGRRFSVVGEEIRKLADRVGGSTKEIRALIEEIRAAVNATVMATETGAKTVDAGTQRFQELQEAFSRIGEIVIATTQAGKEIELSTKQQATAVEQVNVAISNVAQATKEAETSSQQTLQTATQLASLSDDLVRIVRTQQA